MASRGHEDQPLRSFRWTSAARVIRLVVIPFAIEASVLMLHGTTPSRRSGTTRWRSPPRSPRDGGRPAAVPEMPEDRRIECLDRDFDPHLLAEHLNGAGLIVRWIVRPVRQSMVQQRTAYGAPLAPVIAITRLSTVEDAARR